MTRPGRILRRAADSLRRIGKRGILRTALIEAELNAGSEALIQPFVYRYTQKLGSPYSLTDALTRVVAAGVPAAGSSRDQGVQRLAGLDDLLKTFERHSSKAKPGHLDDVHLRAAAKAQPVDHPPAVCTIQPGHNGQKYYDRALLSFPFLRRSWE